ncbi:hypothetical protein BT96DRAFT_625917 [Gymnopus androsaceus JB14]|uniref:Uncharacterized protein n=1 Tax=Gymnopus androsaceus JB14 TaxID=1447944 RepID=A0A6A4IK24_9AGAR|nr:hypothetical protein BT96DRAFT_625917 [Gymnopus androsaceus JB14]
MVFFFFHFVEEMFAQFGFHALRSVDRLASKEIYTATHTSVSTAFIYLQLRTCSGMCGCQAVPLFDSKAVELASRTPESLQSSHIKVLCWLTNN